AQKILLSIISGEQAELQMDELTDIIEYIQETAGDDAEVIFGHGVDPDLKESIRVTIIATGFDREEFATVKPRKKRVIDLESNRQINLFNDDDAADNKSNDNNQSVKRVYTFQQPFEHNDD